MRMATAIQDMLRSSSFETSWAAIMVSLISKKAVTRASSDMRPISGLCHFRKLLGCIWMDACLHGGWLPSLDLCVVVSLVRLRLFSPRLQNSRRSGQLQSMGRLDLRQACGKIKHNAVIDALLEKQIPMQLIAAQQNDVCSVGHSRSRLSDPSTCFTRRTFGQTPRSTSGASSYQRPTTA